MREKFRVFVGFLLVLFHFVSTSCWELQSSASPLCRTSTLPSCGEDGRSLCVVGAGCPDAESSSEFGGVTMAGGESESSR